MARVPSKSVKGKAAKPVDITVPSFDSEVESGDLLLINRSGVDYNTNAGDLAQYVGDELGIDAIAGEINTELGKLEVSIDGVGSDLGELEAKVDGNTANIGVNAGGISDNADGIAANVTAIANNKTEIDANAAAIAVNVTAIAASDAESVRQNSWTGIPSGTNVDNSATHAARITKNEADILALQGALVYEGVGDISQAPEITKTGHFYLCAADGSATGWTGLSTVKENSYYAYDGSKWEEAGSAAVVIPDPATGALTLTSSNKGIDVEVGTGFNANSSADVEYSIKLDLNDEGGLVIVDDGIGIKPKPGNGIIVDGDGISVDSDFIETIAGPVPDLDAVTNKGSSTSNGITVLGVTATGTQAQSSYLLKNIANLPSLADA